ncbi:MAG: hypothetical protein ACSHYA_19990, partial [Opitutaceae bacterium]
LRDPPEHADIKRAREKIAIRYLNGYDFLHTIQIAAYVLRSNKQGRNSQRNRITRKTWMNTLR